MKPSRPRARSSAELISTLLVAALLSLLAGEAVVRLAATWLPAVRLLAEPVGSRLHEPQSFAEFREAFADHLEPFREWWGFRSNSLGFHDVEFAAKLPDGAFRVVALGDSFAYGTVPYPHAHLTITERWIDARMRRSPGGGAATAFEIDNLGVPASGLSDYELVYHFVGRGLAPDLVLVHVYLGNDPQDFADAQRFGAASSRPRSWLLTFLSRARRLLLERARGGGVAAEPSGATGTAGEPSGPRVFRDEDPELSRPMFSDTAFADILRNELRMLTVPGTEPDLPDWPAFLAALDGLVRHVQADGTRVALVLAPSRLQVHPEELHQVTARSGLQSTHVDPTLPNRRITERAAALGLPVIDLTPALAAARVGGRLYLVNDTHWSLRGNAVAAAELARQLADRGLVPIPASEAAAGG